MPAHNAVSRQETDAKVYRYLKDIADRGGPMPTNPEIAHVAGFESESIGRKVLLRLKQAGLIKVERLGRNQRQAILVETGQVLLSNSCSNDMVHMQRPSKRTLPKGKPGEDDKLKADFLKKHGVTRCPSAAVATTTAQIAANDTAAIRQYNGAPDHQKHQWLAKQKKRNRRAVAEKVAR